MYSENDSGSTVTSTYLPDRWVASSDDSILELEPVMYVSHLPVATRADTETSHPSTFWTSSRNTYFLPLSPILSLRIAFSLPESLTSR